MKKIFISSDHAGYKLKEQIKKYLKTKNIICFDLGPSSNKKVDYPIYAHKLAKSSTENIGWVAKQSDLMNVFFQEIDNYENIFIMTPKRLLSKKKACSFVNLFLNTNFEGGRHLSRIRRI